MRSLREAIEDLLHVVRVACVCAVRLDGFAALAPLPMTDEYPTCKYLP